MQKQSTGAIENHLLKLPVELRSLEVLHDSIGFLVQIGDVLPEALHCVLPAVWGGISLAHSTGIAAYCGHMWKAQINIQTSNPIIIIMLVTPRAAMHLPVMTARARIRATAFMVVR